MEPLFTPEDETLILEALDLLVRHGRTERALAFLDRHPELVPKGLPAGSWRQPPVSRGRHFKFTADGQLCDLGTC